MENFIVILIVGLAAFYLGRSYYKKYKKKTNAAVDAPLAQRMHLPVICHKLKK